jgi:Ca-activated chloride channel homolog
MIWASPWAFLFFVPLGFLVVLLVWRRGKRRPMFLVSDAELMRVGARIGRAQLAWLPSALLLMAAVLAILALARPQKTESKIKRNVEGIDIMIVLDISDSMLIEDMNPNRIEACKRIIEEFVRKRVSDRIGYIVFSGESYTRVPLTLDYPVVIRSIRTTKILRNIKMGTAIGVALANGVARLRDSTAKSRVMIFLTDGENNTGTVDPETALEIAKGYGIRIYAIGAGKDGDAQLPVETKDAFGRTIRTYQPIHSTVNDALLGKMAGQTGGKYYRATTENALKRIFDEIDGLERSKIETQQYTKYADLFPRFLGWAAALMLLALILQMVVFRRVP